jgi:hypothetical protein
MRRLSRVTLLSLALLGVASAANAAVINFTDEEAVLPVSCCGTVAPNSFSGVTVNNVYWCPDPRDTFDGEGIAVDTDPATIVFDSVTTFVTFQYWVIYGFTGTYSALDSLNNVVDTFVVGAPNVDALGTHTFNGAIKTLQFSGTRAFIQVSGVEFESSPVPEPASLTLLGLGLAAAVRTRARRKA